MRLCLDEHYSPHIAAELRAAGYDVTSVKERRELTGLSDEELLAIMTSERRALLTENVQDFAPLLSRIGADGGTHYGIVYSAARSMPRSRATLGLFVDALASVLQRFPGDDDFANRTEWLTR